MFGWMSLDYWLSKIRYTHVNWVENRILIVNELKRAGKNTEKFGI